MLDTVFPNANRLFSSPIRGDGSEKWVDSVAEFWHCRCVSEKSEKAFTNKYQRWCRKHGYNFNEAKAHTIHAEASGHVGVMPKSETIKLLVEQAVSQLRATSAALAALKQEMQSLACPVSIISGDGYSIFKAQCRTNIFLTFALPCITLGSYLDIVFKDFVPVYKDKI